MKTYFIKTSHEIEIDEYKNGLTKYVNSYNLDAQIKAETPREAIKKYFKNILFYSFDFKNAYIFHLEDDSEEKNVLAYDTLVDEESNEPTESEIKLWKKGEKILYNNRTYLKIYELNPAII
jgi:hypothetical protein